MLLRKANWISHILRINCLFHDVIEGQMTEVKGVVRRITNNTASLLVVKQKKILGAKGGI